MTLHTLPVDSGYTYFFPSRSSSDAGIALERRFDEEDLTLFLNRLLVRSMVYLTVKLAETGADFEKDLLLIPGARKYRVPIRIGKVIRGQPLRVSSEADLD